MTPLDFALFAFPVAFGAGLLGALLGFGGGVIIVPALTLLLEMDIRFAIGASIVSVVATSTASSSAYLKKGLVNVRVGMFLELAMVGGALAGALAAGLVPKSWLYLLFAGMLLFSVVAMLRRGDSGAAPVPADPLADALRLHGSYFDDATGQSVSYRVARPGLGFAIMFFVGAVSGMLGAGAGALRVPATDLAMRLPMKVSAATSTFMLGVTAAASAGVYFARGDIDAFIAAPVAAGVLAGSSIGSALLGRIGTRVLRWVFVVVLCWIGFEMLRKGLR
ncbi:MAG: sulfite exporter TauE/SafE family protein [Myxococcales bacterium]|jgi:uncharacterized membrane protein YfcA